MDIFRDHDNSRIDRASNPGRELGYFAMEGAKTISYRDAAGTKSPGMLLTRIGRYQDSKNATPLGTT